MKKLIKEYETICNKIVDEFSKKQELEFDGWVGDEVGGIACFCEQYFFNIDDLILDLKRDMPKGFILQWQNDGLDAYFEEEKQTINYYSYIMGLRYKDLQQTN